MSRFTKQAIVASFLKLATKKQVNKITVRDIVEDCGVNRNTFYYYFSDIYGLIEDLLRSETEKAIERGRSSGSLAEGCISTVEMIYENRDAFRNIYNAIGRDSAEYIMSKAMDGVLEGYVRRRTEGSRITDTDVSLIAGVCRNVFFGMLSEWVRHNLRDDPREYLVRIEFLFEDAITNALKRAVECPSLTSEEVAP